LYDKPEYVDQAMKKLEVFYKENLLCVPGVRPRLFSR
jgi:hypothetical protein